MNEQELAVLRRQFVLSSLATTAAAILGGHTPPPLSSEGLQVITYDLNTYNQHWIRGETTLVDHAVSMTAVRLVRELRDASTTAALYRPLAETATVATMLAGLIAHDLNDYTSAARWHEVATSCARLAGNRDMECLTLEDQAWAASFSLDHDRARALLDQMPVRQASPAVLARVELGRASVLAAAGRGNPALVALERAEKVADRLDDPSVPMWRSPIIPGRVAKFRGFVEVELGGGRAYPNLRRALAVPGTSARNLGIIHIQMARAAMQRGELDRACAHAGKAHGLFVVSGSSGQMLRIRRFRSGLAPYADAAAVRDLDDQLHTDTRYLLCRTDQDGRRIHQRGCRYLKRGGGRPWGAVEGLTPEQVVRSPKRVDRRTGRRYEVCGRCMPPDPDPDPGPGG